MLSEAGFGASVYPQGRAVRTGRGHGQPLELMESHQSPGRLPPADLSATSCREVPREKAAGAMSPSEAAPHREEGRWPLLSPPQTS